MFVTRGKLRASDPRWTGRAFAVGKTRVYRSTNHMRNFLDCVKSRRECVAPAEIAHRSITPGHLGYVAQTLGKALRWNAKSEVFVDNDEANQLLHTHQYRSPWSLEGTS